MKVTKISATGNSCSFCAAYPKKYKKVTEVEGEHLVHLVVRFCPSCLRKLLKELENEQLSN